MGKREEKIDIPGLRKCSQKAFSELLNHYGLSSFRVAMQFIGDADSARDIVQETVIKVINKIDTLKEGTPFPPWYFQILTNTCRDWKRNYFRRFRTNIDTINQLPVEITFEENSSDCELLRALITKMPPKMKMIFILHYQEEFTVNEVGEILGISADTVRVQLMKGRKFLREIYEKKLKEI